VIRRNGAFVAPEEVNSIPPYSLAVRRGGEAPVEFAGRRAAGERQGAAILAGEALFNGGSDVVRRRIEERRGIREREYAGRGLPPH
jgi:hypothetical protein